MHSALHREVAHDRQHQLLRNDRTAAHLAAARASERAELDAERRRALRFEPHRASVLAVIWRRLRTAQDTRPIGV
jgi:hypothetical protein